MNCQNKYALFSLLLTAPCLTWSMQQPSACIPTPYHIDLSNIDARDAYPILEQIIAAEIPQIKSRQQSISLDLSHNNLKELPTSIEQIERLQEISLSHNKLWHKALAPLFQQCIQLQEIDLTDNDLKFLPNSLLRLKKLYSLILFNNQVAHQTLAELCEQCRSLQKLDLCFNCLKSLPSQLARLSNLRTLYLGYNNLTAEELTPIFDLTSLRILDLSGNGLCWLPEDIKRLTNLQKLSLADNSFNDKAKEAILTMLHKSAPQATVIFERESRD